MDLGEWLRSLGLSEYEPTFRDNQIDGEVLRNLTRDDLKELGVAFVGHRRKLLSAIARLSATSVEPTALAKVSRTRPPAHDAAERRQLTVMFCDLVGSTAMSARFDPEDMHEIVAAYHKCCASSIDRNGGFVAQHTGDGMLAYFGYPLAHEHDAERAVGAALEIVEAAPKLATAAGAPLHARVGIATGIVVVGHLMGSGEESQARRVVGDAPNLAARLQGIAEPDSVVIAEGTRRLLGDLFEFRDLGAQELKGAAGPTRVYAVLRESPQESRFEALHAGGVTALVGREEESELLLCRWAKAKSGQGQVVLLSGEAGIGKSRLAATILERLAGEPHVRLRYFCSPQHSDSALYPIIGHMARAAGLARDDDGTVRLDKLDALLARAATTREDAALIAEMLSLPNDGRYPALELSPQQRRQKILEALIGLIEAIARETPVLMILEDAHWADPSSLEVFRRLADKMDNLPVLLLVTFRPEFATRWIGRPHVTVVTLDRLAPGEVMALIDRVAGDKPLAANIRQDIVERTDGIPLFVEEMTKALLEAEGEGVATRAIASIPSSALAVPASLHASLMARLDRLGAAKGIAQIGAVIGREFSHALLAFVAELPEPGLSSTLYQLLQSGLLSRHGAPPHSTYQFKHALVQDAAYGTLLREPRRALHARIAEVLEGQFPDIAESQPELLARHCTEAGQVEKAAGLWGKAGQRSLERSALIEAEVQFRRALEKIAVLPSTCGLRRQGITFQVGLANALMTTKGYGAPETRASFGQARLLLERAEALGEPPEDPLAPFSVLYGFWVANYVGFNRDALHALAAQFLALAQKQSAAVPIMIGHRLMGPTLLNTGAIAEGRAHLDRAMALYDFREHRQLAMQFGLDNGVTILSWRALALWLLGYPDRAAADMNNALQNARKIGYAGTLMFALNFTLLTQFNLGNHAEAKAQADELVALADEKGALFWKSFGMLFKGCAFAFTGEASEAVQTIASSMIVFRSTGSIVLAPFHLSQLAKAHAVLGQFGDAWRCIGEAMTSGETTGETWFEADIHRIAGEIEMLSPERDAAKAQTHFERALEIARVQQARSWELRAAMSMARLWRDQGKRPQAHDLLAPVYGWFTEGFDTLDLKDAKALLEELA
jgi:class 3 adenylate cyclase/predicted ATPase